MASSHLKTVTVLILPFHLYSFISLVWFLKLRLPALCWIKVVRVRILVLFLILEKVLSALLLSVMFAVSLICIVCVMMQHVPLYQPCGEFLSEMDGEFFKIFYLYWDDLDFYSLSLLMWCVMLVHLQILNHPWYLLG